MRVSFIFVTQKERASSNKKPTKIKYSPAHVFKLGEKLREKTSSLESFYISLIS